MKIVTVDMETFWSATHSLSRMSPMTYVMHPETEIQSCAIKINDGPTRVVFGEQKLKKLFSMIDWSDAVLVGHNMSEFDSMILAWRFGVNPKLWACTLAMARPIYAKTSGLSLAKVGAVLCPELGDKGSLEATNTKGKKLADFTPDEIKAMEVYNVQDTELCYGIFQKLLKVTSTDEMKLIDATIRMLTEPKFELDTAMLKRTLGDEQARKKQNLMDVAEIILDETDFNLSEGDARIELVRSELASSKKFSEVLRELNVDVPMKPSPSDPEKQIPALSKTDEGFLALQEHEDPMVVAAAMARLGVKSTLLETRIEKFLEAGEQCDGMLPVPLRYYGADTTGRWSGWAYNPQNLPRIDPSKPKASDALRSSLRAPKGYKVVVADLSGIELRVNMFLWKVPYAMDLFKASPDKADLYKYFAAKNLYKIEESAVTKNQRQIGKISHLGLGFGAGAVTFKNVAKIMGGVTLTDKESETTVYAYRDAHDEIVKGWKTCHQALTHINAEEEFDIDPWGMCTTSAEGIVTPKGMIRYPNLREETDDDGKKEWVYGEGRHKSRIYAGKITENIVQHLARCAIADHLLSIKKETGFTPALTVHDELVYVAPDAEADDLLETVQRHMRSPLDWWPELITWSEGDIADTYGAAK